MALSKDDKQFIQRTVESAQARATAESARLAVEQKIAAMKAKAAIKRNAYSNHSRKAKATAKPMASFGMTALTAREFASRMFGSTPAEHARAIACHGGQSERFNAALADWAKNRDALLERKIAENRARRARSAR
jgi:hypothetical protein